MAGLTRETPQPTGIVVHRQSRALEVAFDTGESFRIPFELMRVYSPSAEVQGHGPGQEILQIGKRDVDIVSLNPVGNYAVQPLFSDGHASGIFSWDYLYRLGKEGAAMWLQYQERLAKEGETRDSAVPAAISPVDRCR